MLLFYGGESAFFNFTLQISPGRLEVTVETAGAVLDAIEGGPDDLDRRRTWGTDVESAWGLTLSQGVTPALASVKQSAVAFWRELEMMRRLAGDAALAGELPTAAPPPPRQKPARRARRTMEQ